MHVRSIVGVDAIPSRARHISCTTRWRDNQALSITTEAARPSKENVEIHDSAKEGHDHLP
jgi:hypothetical protein